MDKYTKTNKLNIFSLLNINNSRYGVIYKWLCYVILEKQFYFIKVELFLL